ncbi:MAG: choice-of-anchor tandem repeat GloVer-containing protein [Candidatus Cybelea sp.]
MKHLRNLVGACLSAALLTACGGSNTFSSSAAMPVAPQIVAPESVARQPLTGNGYKLLYSFGKPPDGESPNGLISVHGELYGTTSFGGSGGCQPSGCNIAGTVFDVTTSGHEHVLYSFEGAPDGLTPSADPVAVNGELYGPTLHGGSGQHCSGSGFYGCGIIFKVSTSGMEHVLYSFKGRTDGANPDANLIAVNGALYGTTTSGGTLRAGGNGTVFELSTSGQEHVLHRFAGSPNDGADPLGSLISVKGTLYGTTQVGGAGYGTVFSVAPSGTETVLHSFAGSGDGAYPQAGLLNVKGTLYGTTTEGGANNYGTVFSITPSGTETVLHSFGGSGDGATPVAGLINVKGTLYGTTIEGGSRCRVNGGCGTVFEVTTSGQEHVRYSFKGRHGDGAYPAAALTAAAGVLYGTTLQGGASGAGTVFRISP